MSNNFGGIGITPGLGDVFAPLYDPRPARGARRRFFRDDIPELRHANSLWVSNGMAPARGWLLLRRGDFALLDHYSVDQQLNITDLGVNPEGLTFNQLTVVQARCVTRGNPADPDALYLVEITDRQGVLWNPFFEIGTTSQYNIRAPAYPEQFYALSLFSGGTPFTWDYLCRDLWNQMPLLGPYPGLPIAPVGTPEGYSFPGMSAWEALGRVLDLLGCTVATDLTQAAPYTIVYGGAPDANYLALLAKYTPIKSDDWEYLDLGGGRVPGTVVVYFHKRFQFAGTEETTRADSLQWSSTPLYQVPIAAPAQFSAAQGTHYLWDSFTVRFDVNGNPLAADVATAAAIAQDRVNQYFASVYRSTIGYLRQMFIGALPFSTGSQVDGVCWKEDFSRRQGWITDTVRGPMPAWPELREVKERGGRYLPS